MSYIINGIKVQESVFWNSLQGLASERQLCLIFEGRKLNIGGTMYYIEGLNNDK